MDTSDESRLKKIKGYLSQFEQGFIPDYHGKISLLIFSYNQYSDLKNWRILEKVDIPNYILKNWRDTEGFEERDE